MSKFFFDTGVSCAYDTKKPAVSHAWDISVSLLVGWFVQPTSRLTVDPLTFLLAPKGLNTVFFVKCETAINRFPSCASSG